ncbi:mitochondrial substrate carrier family protein [Cavenderia fasciculata]|uniref:Mitochondrial substrate carrier family protein n=1 Tax=Cavenderia fasciculata TaxID=261658 RepID=F4QC21_CACFS|nr:mitochondrial substrate carrier family protein [Cavenderia fasciculata]EGG13508.1 mitochondrial substrate carrier family protein [Cavenderia fasciculata]|eukprot:XP_004350212.1 mitochondrial substrate carrier family protein [Cavenderia fasciculata]
MSNEVKRESFFATAAKDIVAGSVGGVAQLVTGHPLDTIKVRLQTQPVGAPLYSGTMDCLKKTIAQEGFGGLYKGVTSPLVGLCLMNAVMFFSYGQAKKAIQGDSKEELSVEQLAKAGAIAGLTIAFVESPVDLFKSQLQVPGQTQFNGLADVAKKIYQSRGIRGVYQGFSSTLVRNVPANCCYFASYELARRAFLEPGQLLEDLPTWKVLVSGGIGGMSYWTLTFPIDVIKSSLQTDSIVPSQRRFQGLIDCASKIYKQQGIAGFYKGFTPCFIRSFPANAACFVAFEKARELMS